MLTAQRQAEANEALKEAGLEFKGKVRARHVVGVLAEDVGFEEMKAPSSNRWKA